MNQPERFKIAWPSEPAGRLMTSGSQEKPDPQALHRAARRLGISAAALASAAATAIATDAAATVSSAVAAGAVSAGTVVGKTAGSLLTASVIKGTLIGLGITIAAYSGVQLVDSGAPTSATVSAATEVKPSGQTQRKTRQPSVAAMPSGLQEQEPTPPREQPATPSTGGPTRPSVAKLPRESTIAYIAGAAQSVRIEHPEPPALPPTSQPTSTNGTPSPGSVPAAAATPSSSAAPAALQLTREVASLDRARTAAYRGDAASALRELNSFEHDFGYATLRKEAILVTIDVLLSLGRTAEAVTLARQLLAMGAPATQRVKLQALVNKQP